MSKMYVVVATFEFEAACYTTKLLGVYESQVRAFDAIDCFNFKEEFEENLEGEIVVRPHSVNEFGVEYGKAFYSETYYVAIEGNKESGSSVTFTIFETELK